MRKAVFLDRDGTLIEDRGHLADAGEVAFYGDAVSALRRLQKEFLLFIVTNQPGIAGGILSHDDVARVNGHVTGELARHGVKVTTAYVCPHNRADGCACIKPKPHFLQVAAREYGIDLGRSFVVGDHPHDVELARNAGAFGIYVLTGHGLKHLHEVGRDAMVVSGLGPATDWISGMHSCGGDAVRLKSEILRGADILRKGGLVIFPTETVYGLGANALDARAVARVFEAKQRPRFNPLIVHVRGQRQAETLVREFPPKARTLAERFWPGPLTVVLPKADLVPDIVTAGLPSVAIRVPAHALAQELLRESDVPIAAPSANRFGGISPTMAGHAEEETSNDADLVLDGGPCAVGVESTVISFLNGRPTMLRPGGVPAEDVRRVIGDLHEAPSEEPRPLSPGRLARHYAPRTPLFVASSTPAPVPGKRAGLLAISARTPAAGFTVKEILSPDGDMREAAANLFSALRRLDAKGLDLIVAESVPDKGIGAAIMDRLRRACSGFLD
jgi:L-threonylcarbamoyladenylate synthase